MTRSKWLGIVPNLLVAAGMLLSTWIAVLTAESNWMGRAGPLVFAVTVLGADVLSSRLSGKPSGPSWAALLLASSFLLAGLIVTLRDPSLVKTLIPILGAGAWVTLLLRPEGRCRACRGV